jgi:NADH dehydrogenase [ubiquinone] 1 alpha subcomplex assembly factor 7
MGCIRCCLVWYSTFTVAQCRELTVVSRLPYITQPGQADVTADVDFSLCRTVAQAKGALVLPLLTQSAFLMRMGIVARMEQLLNADETSDEQANALMQSFKYLVEPQQMGQKFKVLSIANPQLRSVAGFTDP